jgi:myo-inositol-1(or 4)-monophosphatase
MYVEVLAKAAREAGRLVWEMFIKGEGLEEVRRGDVDVTRRVDAVAEAAVIEVLRREIGSFTLLAEEAGIVKFGGGDLLVVVDPLDGSGNFALGIPYFAVMLAAGVGARRLEDLTESAIYIPAADRLYTADPRRGLLVNGVPVKPRERPEPVVFVELGRRFPIKSLQVPLAAGYKLRSGGCAGCQLLASVLGAAAGYVDVRRRLGPWDVAAPLVAGRHNPRFRYCVREADLRHDARVDIVAGHVDFVEKTCSQLL